MFFNTKNPPTKEMIPKPVIKEKEIIVKEIIVKSNYSNEKISYKTINEFGLVCDIDGSYLVIRQLNAENKYHHRIAILSNHSVLEFVRGEYTPQQPQPPIENIFDEIHQERKRQDEKWGVQNHPILDPLLIEKNASPERVCSEYEIPTEDRAKELCEKNFKRKTGTYMHILVEEISEVASCGKDVKALREELIQTAAVTIAMIQSLDRNQK
jgi:hypothetical protein